jgi:hypothetical protein
MNIVAHMTECKETSTIASARIARFIEQILPEFKLVDTKMKAIQPSLHHAKIHNLIIVNGPMAFCDFLPELADFVERAEKVIWVQQDYTIMPPSKFSNALSPFRKVFNDKNLRPDFWTTVQRNVIETNDRYINWNMLTWDLFPMKVLAKKPTLMYYGAYREKREKDFIRYFGKGVDYKVSISTTPVRIKKFTLINKDIKFFPTFKSIDQMPECSASIYIEDPRSSEEFHSPANRFYELLSAGIPILFDSGSLAMLKKAGIIPHKNWVVSSKEDVAYALKTLDLSSVQQKQRDMWAKDYKQQLKDDLLKLWDSF